MTEGQDPSRDQVDGMNDVWVNTVDGGKFICAVTQTNKQVVFQEEGRLTFDDQDTQGVLTVYERDGDLLLMEDVTISHGAIFGPDMYDLDRWQRMCIPVIDKWYADHGMNPPSNN